MREAVEAWRVEHRHLDELSAANAMHAVAVALLLERLGWNVPDDLHDGSPRRQVSREHALRRARMRDAANLCRWAASADTLATWILRAVAEHGPDNLCAYLRKASAQGDPGTLLHSTKHNEIGRGAESVSDYGASTERELEGAYATQVAQLTEGGAAVMGALDPVQRARLRGQLAKLMQLGRTDGARRVLLQLVGDHPSDITLARAVDGICTVAEARRLIA